MPTRASAAILPMTAPAMRPTEGLDGLGGALVLVLELVGDEMVVCGVVLDALVGNGPIDERSDDIALPTAGMVKLAASEFALNCTIPDIIASVGKDCCGRLMDAAGGWLEDGGCIGPSSSWVLRRTCRDWLEDGSCICPSWVGVMERTCRWRMTGSLRELVVDRICLLCMGTHSRASRLLL
jgi:hypothetical protein